MHAYLSEGDTSFLLPEPNIWRIPVVCSRSALAMYREIFSFPFDWPAIQLDLWLYALG